jgi:hypothetical protein
MAFVVNLEMGIYSRVFEEIRKGADGTYKRRLNPKNLPPYNKSNSRDIVSLTEKVLQPSLTLKLNKFKH